MEPRHYQTAAVEACWDYISKHSGNPCIVLPTGAGKSLVLAMLIRDAVQEWQGRVLLLSHVKELLVQNATHIKTIAPDIAGAIGVYSAGLRSRDKDHPCIVAGIQSVHTKACELGRFDIILIDEAHTIPDSGEGMYRSFLADARTVNPAVRLIGLTATPYRMKTGYICGPDNLLHEICYEISVKQLIEEGFLCNLISKAGVVKADLSSVHVRGGEYVADELEDAMNTDRLVEAACQEIVDCTFNRMSNLIFASGIKHGGHIAQALKARGETVAEVYGETPNKERDTILSDFKARKIKHVINVGVLTTGFDARNIDCISLLRPTMSPGLYYQMLGRGLRINEGKENCLILDFASNVLTHGPIDQIKVKPKKLGEPGEAPVKECPSCHGIIHAAYTECPFCGHLFGRDPNHAKEASFAAPVSGGKKTEVKQVYHVRYSEHYKRGPEGEGKPPTLRVEYVTSTGLLRESVSEWISIEGEGWARQKAEAWWSMRSIAPCPESVERAVTLAEAGALAPTEAVTVSIVSGEKWPKIIGYKLGARPEYSTPETGWATFEEVLDTRATNVIESLHGKLIQPPPVRPAFEADGSPLKPVVKRFADYIKEDLEGLPW